MKAELVDGRVVELTNNCGCGTHDGPHWLHMNSMWRETNLAMLHTNPLGFMAGESQRLRQLAFDMRANNVVKLQGANNV